jgi:xanthine dehydrogenase small subunit
VALGGGGFADDSAPRDALVAMRRPDGSWVVGESIAAARLASGKVQGRRSTAPLSWPVDVPAGDWVRTLRTTWVEPGYLEPDASWCEPGGVPTSPLGNGGAFGGKTATGPGPRSDIGVDDVARRLADEHGRPVRVLASREDVVRLGPKRPPMAIGVRADGTGVVHVARTPGIVEAITGVAPDLAVIEVDAIGPSTSAALRGAGWAEVAAVLSSLRDGPDDTVRAPSGSSATARVADDGSVHVRVRCGVDPTDELELAVLRSYCVGAAHMALGWVRSEALAVDADGVPVDLTIRSFGILRAVDTPAIHVDVEPDGTAPGATVMSNGSDAVFAAVAAAAWRAHGFPDRWPARDGYGRVP